MLDVRQRFPDADLSRVDVEWRKTPPPARRSARTSPGIAAQEGMVGFVNVKTDYRARATTVRFSSRET
ncbi:MAG: hypothetical protein JO007_00535 [Alphaproteobacteria bacterium]|nr:hypothetical protein [Alphaproteobacteria bacterium]